MNPTAAEIRAHIATWPTWQRDLWLGSIVVCPLILLPMELWLWLIFGVTVGVAMVLAVRVHRLQSQLTHADAMITRLAGENAAALADVVPIDGPGLRVVPEQRQPVADGYFPVHTEIDDDDLTALMRATEEK